MARLRRLGVVKGARELRLRPVVLHEVERILYDYLTHILERDLKSVDFLHRLRREADAVVREE